MGWSEQAVDQLYRAIGQRIRDMRTRAKVTQTQLGERLDLTRSSVANIEAGRQRVTVHGLMQIAEELDVTIHDLLIDPGVTLSTSADSDLSVALSGQPDTTAKFVASALRRAE